MALMTRREVAFAAGALSAAAAPSSKYVVVGAGVFGAWTAYQLRRAGHNVTLIDQYGPANARASSGGESRIIRCSYGPDELYTRMALRSLTLWPEFFHRAGVDWFHRTGVLWMCKPGNHYVEQSRETLRKTGVPFQDLSPADLKSRYPQMHVDPSVTAIFEPESGALMARRAVAAVVEQFVRDGGVYHLASVPPPHATARLKEIRTAEGVAFPADAFIFACGPWLGRVFPDVLGKRIFPTRQEVVFFGIPPGDRRFEGEQMPVWLDFSDTGGMYGFPDLENRGFKVAFDRHGPAFDPDAGNRIVGADRVKEARHYLLERFPDLAAMPVVDSRVCQYENTSNGDFVIDRHPALENVWLVGGGSGHGFKHGPAVGEYVAARVTGADTPAVEPRFSLASKGTQQSRAVY
jgi:monomeric sarcosine oxidase